MPTTVETKLENILTDGPYSPRSHLHVKPYQAVRRLILFLATLLSGGLLIFDRPIVATGMLILAAIYSVNAPLRISKKGTLIFAWLFLIYAVTFLRPNAVDIEATVTRTINFLLAFVLFTIYAESKTELLKKDLLFLLKLMAWQAIATVAFAVAAPSLFAPININGGTYYTVLLLLTFHHTIDVGGFLVRPDGFFFEPGVFQIYLNLYLYLTLASKKSWAEVIVAIISVFLTQSTTGLVIASLIISSHIYQYMRGKGSFRKYLFFLSAIIIAFPIGIIVYGNIQEKLFGDFAGSAIARQYDLLLGLAAIQQNPLVGIGFGDRGYFDFAETTTIDSVLQPEDGRSTTNGVVSALYSIGIPLGAVLIFSLFNQKLIAGRLRFGLIICLGLFAEALIFTPFFLLFAFSGMTRKRGANVPAISNY